MDSLTIHRNPVFKFAVTLMFKKIEKCIGDSFCFKKKTPITFILIFVYFPIAGIPPTFIDHDEMI